MLTGIIDSGQKIVTNGLVLHLDAAQLRSYPGSGTTWTDLSGNGNNGTLTNGPTFDSNNGGSIVFDGANDYVQVTGSITVSTATLIVWLYRNGTQGNFDGILFSRSSNVTGMGFGDVNFSSVNNIQYTWNGAANTYQWKSNLIPPDLAWSMCVISVAASSATAYLCQNSGITSATNNVSHGSSTLDVINIGRDSFSTRYISGRIGQSLIYNRALSATEVEQNFNATKSRFGL